MKKNTKKTVQKDFYMKNILTLFFFILIVAKVFQDAK